jgi:hypothetical protein
MRPNQHVVLSIGDMPESQRLTFPEYLSPVYKKREISEEVQIGTLIPAFRTDSKGPNKT